MSIAHALSSPSTTTHRALLFGSLALNLFFIGVTAALLIRNPAPVPRNVAARIERLAATLPAVDGEKMRAGFRAERTSVEGARADYERARDAIRAVLRREPFDPAAMQDAMAKARAARQEFDIALQNMIARVAANMSPSGRQALADYSPSRQRGRR